MKSTNNGRQGNVQRRARDMINIWTMGTILAAKGREVVKAGKQWLIDSLQIYEEFLCREW